MERIIALESFIYGSAWDATAPADLFDPAAIAPDHSALRAAADAMRARAAKKGQRGANPYADQAFAAGLSELLDGITGAPSS